MAPREPSRLSQDAGSSVGLHANAGGSVRSPATEPQADAVPDNGGAVGARGLPQYRKRLIGRDEVVGQTVARLQKGRLVTLVGYGGVGKTSVALSASVVWERLAQTPVLFLDLARISDADFLWTTILATLGVTPLGDPRETVLRLLADRFTLIVLDNCEHVAACLAGAVSAILDHAPAVRVLATSREELRIPDEGLIRIEPLSVPEADSSLGVAEASRHSAVELLIERIRERTPDFALSDRNAVAAADLCRRLDGIPLAIELAAARVATIGIDAVIEQLASRFELLADQDLPETSRHAGLLAVLDWSYGYLTPLEQSVLRTASAFASDFAASDLWALAPQLASAAMVGAALNGLLAKSMVQEAGPGRLRLLETTRAYALHRLEAAHERKQTFDALALHVLNRLRAAHGGDRATTLALWDQIRSDAAAALDWTLRGPGDPGCGIDIVAGALPTWLLLSEISRYAGELGAAITAIRTFAPHRRADELQFEFSRSIALYFVRGPNRDGIDCGKRAYGIAVDIDVPARQLDTAWNLHAQTSHWGAYREAWLFALRYLETAKRLGDPVRINQGWRVVSRGYDDLGQHNRAARIFREIVQPMAGATARPVTAWGADEKIIRICMDSRVHWFAGRQQVSLEIGAHAVTVGQSEGQAHTFCWMLAQHMIPMALWAGAADKAQGYLEILIDIASHHFENWTTWAEMLRETIDVVAGGRPSARLVERIRTSWPARQDMFATLHPSLACDQALLRAQQPDELCWSTPDLLRIGAERAFGTGDLASATALIHRSIGLAETRGNLPSLMLGKLARDRMGLC